MSDSSLTCFFAGSKVYTRLNENEVRSGLIKMTSVAYLVHLIWTSVNTAIRTLMHNKQIDQDSFSGVWQKYECIADLRYLNEPKTGCDITRCGHKKEKCLSIPGSSCHNSFFFAHYNFIQTSESQFLKFLVLFWLLAHFLICFINS